MTIKERILPAGKYIIGDPCYLFNDNWSDILCDNDYFECDLDKQVINGLGIAVMPTEHGDGGYFDSDNFEYSVDAGLIGVMPYELLYFDNEMTETELLSGNLMRVMEFTSPILVETSDYELRISNMSCLTTTLLTLDTKWSDSDSDDEYDEDDNE
jgi:hypothetical protein